MEIVSGFPPYDVQYMYLIIKYNSYYLLQTLQYSINKLQLSMFISVIFDYTFSCIFG